MKKHMNTKSKISAYMLRSAAVALLLSCAIVGLSSAFNSSSRRSSLSGPSAHSGSAVKPEMQTKTLTFADRVAYQRAIEEVYWRHRIWPAANGVEKPSLDKVMSQAQIEKKVEDYLRNSQALEDYWQKPITPDQLQAEMERMATHTKQPEVLRELFAALGNDPFVIAEIIPAWTSRRAWLAQVEFAVNSETGSATCQANKTTPDTVLRHAAGYVLHVVTAPTAAE